MIRSAVSRRRGVQLGALVGLLLGAGLLALAPAASASAHDYLVSSTPASDSTQTKALTKVVLTFDDRVLDLSGDGSSNVVEVTHGSKHYESGCPVIADTDVSVPVALGTSGRYTVTWQIVSADGHVVSNSIAFAYKRPQDATASAGRSSRPTCGDQSSAGAGGSTGAAAAGSASSSTGASSAGSSGLPVALGVGGGIIVVALAAVVIVLTRSRAREAAASAEAGSGASRQREQPRREPRSRRTPPPPPSD